MSRALVLDDDELPVLAIRTRRGAKAQLDALQHDGVVDGIGEHAPHRPLGHHRLEKRHVEPVEGLGDGRDDPGREAIRRAGARGIGHVMTLSPHLMTIHWVAPGDLRKLPGRFMPSLVSLTASLHRHGRGEQSPWSRGAGDPRGAARGRAPANRPKSRFPRGPPWTSGPNASEPSPGVRRRIPNCDEKGVVRGVEVVSTSSGAERENRTGVWPAYGRWKTNCCVGCAGGCVSWGSGPTAAASSPPFGMFSTPSWVDSVV